jgi:hypothetical protein
MSALETGRLTYIAQVAAGAYGDYERAGCSVSTYGSLEELLAEYGPADRIAPGAFVVDARSVPYESQVRESVRGPMVDGSLVDAERDCFTVPRDGISAPFVATIACAFGMGDLMALQATGDPGEPGPFDHVSPAVGAARWQALGARVGIWTGAAVAWSDEQ